MATKNTLFFFSFALLLLFFSSALAASTAELINECASDLQKVVGCLNFASGKAAAPGKECCDSVSDMKASKPQCLCFIILQAHNGSQQIKDMGIQEAKLLQLPSACKLKNASVSECPKLLGIAPNSRAAAVFSDTNSSSSSPATPAASISNSPSKKPDSSNGSKLQSHLAFFLYGFMAGAIIFFAL